MKHLIYIKRNITYNMNNIKQILELVQNKSISIDDALELICTVKNTTCSCCNKFKLQCELSFEEIVNDIYNSVLKDPAFDIDNVFNIMMELNLNYCNETSSSIESRFISKDKIRNTIKHLIEKTLKDVVVKHTCDEPLYSKHELNGFYCEATTEDNATDELYITVGFVPYCGFCLTNVSKIIKSFEK